MIYGRQSSLLMNNRERANLHDIACVLFPHLKEREDDKKKLKILKLDGWEYSPMDDCYTKGEVRLGREYVFSSSLEELRQILHHIAPEPPLDASPIP